MPRLSIWAIRLSVVYLVVGWMVGAVLMINRAWAWAAWPWRMIELHVALVFFGWMLQLVVGVAYWMLPTFGGRQNRGREKAAVMSVVAINAGVIWAVAGVFTTGVPLVGAAVLWWFAALAFGWHAWPRVKAFGD